MKRKVFVYIFSILVYFSLTMGQSADAAAKYVFGGDKDYLPYEFVDAGGQPAGFNIDLLKAIAEVMGLDIEIRLDSWNEVRRQLEDGEIDGITGMYYSPERARLVDFSTPYTYISYNIFVRSASSISSFEELLGKDISVQDGDIMHDYLKKTHFSAKVFPLAQTKDIVKSLSDGKYDAVILPKLQAFYLADREGIANIKPAGPTIESQQYCFAVKKGNDVLVAQLNEGLNILKTTGRYDQIHNKWFGVYETKNAIRELIGYAVLIVIPLLLFLGIALAWSWSMRKTVARKTNELQKELAERVRTEAALRESEQSFSLLCEKAPVMIMSFNKSSKIVLWNSECKKRLGYSDEEIKKHPNPLGLLYRESIETKNSYVNPNEVDDIFREYTLIAKNGIKCVQLWANMLLPNENILSIGYDITERKRMEEELKYQSQHDRLTGLYSRFYYEEAINKLEDDGSPSVGVIVFDVDGLKLINDTMGHAVGDSLLIAAAKVFQESFKTSDIVARIGGDEFVALVPNTTKGELQSICNTIRNKVEKYNLGTPAIHISLSIGYAIDEYNGTKLSDLVIEADKYMYREKLHRSKSARSAIVQTMMKLLEVRDMVTEGHVDRLQDMAIGLAKASGLPENENSDLRLFAQFHDIGKVGIPDRILFKPEALTPEERIEMQQHSEIGQRIASASPDLMHIADWILKHHEWWNGNGYPLRLKEREIPIECRILAIVDAYDAMTSDRPYRKAMSTEKAVAELIKCAGVQFDPKLVEIFVKNIDSIIG